MNVLDTVDNLDNLLLSNPREDCGLGVSLVLLVKEGLLILVKEVDRKLFKDVDSRSLLLALFVTGSQPAADWVEVCPDRLVIVFDLLVWMWVLGKELFRQEVDNLVSLSFAVCVKSFVSR